MSNNYFHLISAVCYARLKIFFTKFSGKSTTNQKDLMSLQMKNGLKHCWFLFSHYSENMKFVRSAALAYSQLCSFKTVWVTPLIRINHKVPCLEVDINILVFTFWNSWDQWMLWVCDTSMNQALKHIFKYLTKGVLTLIGSWAPILKLMKQQYLLHLKIRLNLAA